jgi:hypothetical protein
MPLRPLTLSLLAFPLAGCHPAAAPFVAVGAVEASSVAVFGRGSVDLVYSAISNRDCSIVHLERGDSYCKPPEHPPPPEPFCTRTLGTPECFATPADLLDHPTQLADTPPRPPPAKP